MKKRVGILFLACASTLALSGCLLRNAGPCYGFGCPSRAGAPGSAPQNASAPAGSGGAAVASNGAGKAQSEKPRGFVAFIKNLLPSHHTDVAPGAPAASPAGPAAGK